ncbi:MAG: chemotaxis protein CheX [Thermoguttaceae bacterium]
MNSEFDNALAKVTEDTFASMAFVLPLGEQDGGEDDAPPQTSASIRFSGPFGGSLTLSVSSRMVAILADNILGRAERGSASPEEQQDALKEILNVICGNLLPRIATPSDMFHVSQPRFLSSGDAAESFVDGTLAAAIAVRFDCGRANLSLYLDRPATVSAA